MSKGAQNGTLAIMAGGERAAFERAQPVLAAMGKTVEHFGPSGAGQATKATNQIMCAGIIRACAEAMAFAGAHGLPLDRVVIERSAAAPARAGTSCIARRTWCAALIRRDFACSCTPRTCAICHDMAARFGVAAAGGRIDAGRIRAS